MLQLARRLEESGLSVCLLLREKPKQDTLDILENFAWLLLEQAKMNKHDIYIVPEGWVNALSPGLQQDSRCFVYCQNWAFLFHGLPEKIKWQDLKVQFLAVSYPVALFLEKVLKANVPIIRPVIDTNIFQPPVSKPQEIIRIGYMPRKNRAQIKQIQRIYAERNPQEQIDWFPIQGLEQRAVARALQTCHIFLCSGYPEGFALPPLEAMACACFSLGFTGYGGWDYMRQYQTKETDPESLLRKVPWQGNGLWSADGDTLSVSLDLEKAISWCQDRQQNFQSIISEGQKTSRSYNKENQTLEIFAALNLG